MSSRNVAAVGVRAVQHPFLAPSPAAASIRVKQPSVLKWATQARERREEIKKNKRTYTLRPEVLVSRFDFC
jgi:hypothetical protein